MSNYTKILLNSLLYDGPAFISAQPRPFAGVGWNALLSQPIFAPHLSVC